MPVDMHVQRATPVVRSRHAREHVADSASTSVQIRRQQDGSHAMAQRAEFQHCISSLPGWPEGAIAAQEVERDAWI
jgi:hypothetical protein